MVDRRLDGLALPRKPCLKRRTLLTLLAGLIGAAHSSVAGAADTFPSRPVKVLVGYSAGGAVDAVARSIGQQMSAVLGQPVIVENKPGAATNIAVKALIASPPDGYTLLLAANALAVNPSLFSPPPFDLKRDFTPIGLVGRVPVVIAVKGDSPYKSLQELTLAAKTRPASVTVATPGNGSTPHLAMELFQYTAKVTLRHLPYKGGSQALTDVMGGHVDVVATNALEVLPFTKDGRLRVLAIMSPQRTPVLPGAPTVAESGYPGFEAGVWYGLVAPAGMPKSLVVRLNDALAKAIDSAEVKMQLASAGGVALPGSAEDFEKLLKMDEAKYGKLIREAAIKPD